MGGRGKVALAMKCFFKEMRTDLQLQARRSQQMLSIKIVAVGDSKIGKSTLLRNLERKNFKTELPQNPDWHFGPNIGIFGTFDLKPDQKTMQTSCLDGFLLCWYQNFYLLP